MALSGGMDSTSLLLRLLREGYSVTCVSYLYGQKHSIEIERAMENVERLKSREFIVNHKIIDLRSAMGSFHSALTDENFEVPEGHYEEVQMKQTVVPNIVMSPLPWAYTVGITLSIQIVGLNFTMLFLLHSK